MKSARLWTALFCLLFLCSCARQSSLPGTATRPLTETPVTVTDSVFSTDPTEPQTDLPLDPPADGGSLGSAGTLDGKTVIVSIFADDAGTRWGAEDGDLKREMLRRLSIACAWLTDQSLRYGKEAAFFFDWTADAELYYETSFAQDLVSYDCDYYGQTGYLVQSVDSAALMAKYGAEDIIYLFFFNTDEENDVRPWTVSHKRGDPWLVEFSNVFVRFGGTYTPPPATFAHEILHTFGAHDLYYASEQVPQAYVDHCADTGSRDIMYYVNMGDDIAAEMTDLAAYYAGLTDVCPTVEQWGLAVADRLLP